MKLKPLFDRVIVKPIKAKKTESGIILPESTKEKPCIGKVVAIGSGDDKNKIVVSVGDEILFSKYAGVEFKHEDEDYIALKQSEIILVFEEEK